MKKREWVYRMGKGEVLLWKRGSAKAWRLGFGSGYIAWHWDVDGL